MIGILTYHFAHNYGAVLQTYATQEYLKENKIDSEVIDYRPEKMWSYYTLSFEDRPFYKRIVLYLLRLRRRKQGQLFNEFLNKDMKCSSQVSKSDLPEIADNYNVIISGSDQIWNCEISNNDEAYFLDFANENVFKIGYAISIGIHNTTEQLSYLINKYASKYNRLSFREERAKEIVDSITDIESVTVVDPVFLINKDKWQSLEQKPEGFKEDKYILYYSLREDRELIKNTLLLAKEKKMKIVSIHPTCIKNNIADIQLKNVGPKEFVWMVRNAEYVCTNSFHGTAFACIFNKQAIVVHCNGTSDRGMELFKLIGIGKNEQHIDFSKVDKERLLNKVEFSRKFLLQAVEAVE